MEEELVVMPNHFHGIVWITEQCGGGHPASGPGSALAAGSGSGGERELREPDRERGVPWRIGSHRRPNVEAGSLGVIVRAIKAASTRRINELRGSPGAAVWQRGIFDHVIRSEAALTRIRRYIRENPLRWALDRENPDAPAPQAPAEEPWRI